jgi:4-amino-4-deoxy-L-arabinose transferase-like glycosyltransferase
MMRRKRLALVLIFVTAVLLRLALVVYFRTYAIPAERNHWNFGYELGRTAMSLATGGGYASPLPEPTGPTTGFVPLFPLILAAIFRLFGIYSTASAVAVYTFNSMCAGISCLLTYWVAKSAFGTRVAIVSAALLALYPASIWYAIGTVWDTSLLACEVVLLLGLWLRLAAKSSTYLVFGLGMVMGLILLTNPAPATVFPLIIAAYLRKAGCDTVTVKRALILVAIPTLVFVPWMFRNYLVTGTLAPRCCGGVELMLTNNEQNWRDRRPYYLASMHPANSPAELRLYKQMGELNYDRYSMDRAKAFILANPKKFLDLIGIRIGAWWLGDSSNFTANLQTTRRLATIKRLAILLPLPLLFVGIYQAWHSGLLIWPFVAILFVYPLPYYLTDASERYKFPVEPIALMIATYGLMTVLDRRKPRASEKGITDSPE